MSVPDEPVIDLTNYSYSEHDFQQNIPPRRDRGSNRQLRTRKYPGISYAHARIVNSVPIEVADTTPASPAVTSPRNVPRRSNNNNRISEEKDANVELVRERSPLVRSVGICPICLEEFGNQALVSTRCGHVYCQRCLTQSLRQEKKCPTCRKPMRGSTAYHPIYISRG